MQERYTISDIAKMAGVSPATVSRVLTGKPGVKAPIREEVQRIIQEVGYKPNHLARSLTSGRIDIVGLILDDVRNPYFADVTYYIQRILGASGYLTMLFNSDNQPDKEVRYTQLCQQFGLAGLILVTATGNQELQQELIALQCPVVMVNRMITGFPCDYVIQDNFQAGYLAAQHLIKLGHSRIAYITGPLHSSSSHQRYMGYLQALESSCIEKDDAYIFSGDLKMATGYELGKAYVADRDKLPKAVIVGNDLMALGFMDACKEASVRIPEDLSVVGFDNILFSSLRGIELTTVSQPVIEMAELSVDYLIQRIQKPKMESQRAILEPTLIVRKSTGPYLPDTSK